METFDFCPNSMVPETLPREQAGSVISMNGWTFSARPTTPYQKKFRVKLHGLRWVLNGTAFDNTTTPTINAKRLEEFYERHETWNPFTFTHPHLGALTVRFAAPVTIPAGMVNSGGLVEAVEITLIHHDPGY